MRTRLLSLAAALGVIALATPGCFDRQCDGDVVGPYGERAGEGDFLALDAWESVGPDGKWLDFPAGRTWRFHIPEWERAGRPLLSTAAYISAADTPNAVHPGGVFDNFTPASGNLGEVTHVAPGRFEVTNATCSQYFLRVVARAGPPAPAADSGAGDAQSE